MHLTVAYSHSLVGRGFRVGARYLIVPLCFESEGVNPQDRAQSDRAKGPMQTAPDCPNQDGHQKTLPRKVSLGSEQSRAQECNQTGSSTREASERAAKGNANGVEFSND